MRPHRQWWGRGNGKPSPPVVYSSVCVTFTAQTTDVSGGAGVPHHHHVLQRLKIKQRRKTNTKKIQKKEKTEEKKRGTPWPLLQTPEREGDSGCLGVPSGSTEPAFCLALQDGTVLGRLWVWPRGRDGGRWSGCVPRPTHLRAKQACGWPFRSRPVGLVAHVCSPSGGQMTSFPGLQLSSKPPRSSFPLLQDALLNQCGKTTGLLSMVLSSTLIILACWGAGRGPLPLGSTI